MALNTELIGKTYLEELEEKWKISEKLVQREKKSNKAVARAQALTEAQT